MKIRSYTRGPSDPEFLSRSFLSFSLLRTLAVWIRSYFIVNLLVALAAASLIVFLVILFYKEIGDRNSVSFREEPSEKNKDASRRVSFFSCEYRIASLTGIKIETVTA